MVPLIEIVQNHNSRILSIRLSVLMLDNNNLLDKNILWNDNNIVGIDDISVGDAVAADRGCCQNLCGCCFCARMVLHVSLHVTRILRLIVADGAFLRRYIRVFQPEMSRHLAFALASKLARQTLDALVGGVLELVSVEVALEGRNKITAMEITV